MTPSEILKAALQKIERGWTQGAYARDVQGRETASQAEDAICWCAEGALFAISDRFRARDVRNIMEDVLYDLYEEDTLSIWNDSPLRSKSEVIELFQKAIQYSEKNDASK